MSTLSQPVSSQDTIKPWKEVCKNVCHLVANSICIISAFELIEETAAISTWASSNTSVSLVWTYVAIGTLNWALLSIGFVGMYFTSKNVLLLYNYWANREMVVQ